MSGRTTHKRTVSSGFGRRTAPEITVQPREHAEEISVDPDDFYASMSPEELGEHALRAATQSGYPPADSDAHGIGAIAAVDVPLRLAAYEETSEDDLWTEMLDLSVEFGAWAELGSGNAFEWDDAREATWSRDVDLHQAKVVEASLFDPGSEETMYETRRPHVLADDDSPEHTELRHRRRSRHAAPSRAAR